MSMGAPLVLGVLIVLAVVVGIVLIVLRASAKGAKETAEGVDEQISDDPGRDKPGFFG
jgi:hypothetical protein